MSRQPHEPDVVLTAGFDQKQFKQSLTTIQQQINNLTKQLTSAQTSYYAAQARLATAATTLQKQQASAQSAYRQQQITQTQQQLNQLLAMQQQYYQRLGQMATAANTASAGGASGGRRGGFNPFLTSFGFGFMGSQFPGSRLISSLSIGAGFGGAAGLAGAGAATAIIATVGAIKSLVSVYGELAKKAFELKSGHALLQGAIDDTSQTIALKMYPALKAIQDQEVKIADWIDKNQSKIGKLAETFADLAKSGSAFAESLLLFVTRSGSIGEALDTISSRATNMFGRINTMMTLMKSGVGVTASIIGGALGAPTVSGAGPTSGVSPQGAPARPGGYIASLGGWDALYKLIEEANVRGRSQSLDIPLTDYSKVEQIREQNQRTAKLKEEIALLGQISQYELDIAKLEIQHTRGLLDDIGFLKTKLGLEAAIAELKLDSKRQEEDEARKFSLKRLDPLDKAQAEGKLQEATQQRIEAENRLKQVSITNANEVTAAQIALDRKLAEERSKIGLTARSRVAEVLTRGTSTENAAALTRYEEEQRQRRLFGLGEEETAFAKNMPKFFTPMTIGKAFEEALGNSVNRLASFNSLLGSLTGKFGILGRAIGDLRNIRLPSGAEVGGIGAGFSSLFRQRQELPGGYEGPTQQKFSMTGFIQGAAAIGGIAASVAGIIGAMHDLFTRAAKKMAEAISKEVQDIVSATSKSGKIAEGLMKLEQERVKAISELSGKKGGQKQLDQLLPEINSQLEQMREKQKQIIDDFDVTLGKLQLGSPFDTIFDTIDAAIKKAQEFVGAGGSMEQVQEFFRLTTERIGKDWQARWDAEWKAWVEGAENVAGELVSIDQDAFTKIEDENKNFDRSEKQRQKSLADLKKQYAKQEEEDAKRLSQLKEALIELDQQEVEDILKIQNEGIAERQKTTSEDKRQRIADLQDQVKKDRQNIVDQISNIEDIRAERALAYSEQLAQMEEAEAESQKNHDNTISRIINETERRRQAHLDNMANLQKELDFINNINESGLLDKLLQLGVGPRIAGGQIVVGQITVAVTGSNASAEEIAETIVRRLNEMAAKIPLPL